METDMHLLNIQVNKGKLIAHSRICDVINFCPKKEIQRSNHGFAPSHWLNASILYLHPFFTYGDFHIIINLMM